MNKKLTKSDDRVLAGVCGGLAEYFDFDPVLVRVAYAFLRKAFDMHTFQNLEPDTAYSILVMAYDENGNVLRYPGPDAYLTVTTKKGDNQAPTTPSKHLIVMDVTETSIAIEWEPAKDDVTQDEDIRYVVALTKADDKEDPWRIVHQGTGFHKFTFKDLKPGTRYSFFVMAFDEAGNMIQYPGLDRSVTVETLSW